MKAAGIAAIGGGLAGAMAFGTEAAAANGDPITLGQNVDFDDDTWVQYLNNAYPTGSTRRRPIYFTDTNADPSTIQDFLVTVGAFNYRMQNAFAAEGADVGIFAKSGKTPLRLAGGSDSDTTPHVVGDFVVVDDTVRFCVAAGTPGEFRTLAGPATAGSMHLSPATTRVYDSRSGEEPLSVSKGAFGPDEERTVDATLDDAVPDDARAALVNLTVVSASPSGWVALFPFGESYPGNSSINWTAQHAVVANTTVVGLGGGARFQVRSLAPAHVILDVIGYWS